VPDHRRRCARGRAVPACTAAAAARRRMTDPISLFLICLRASLLSLGGSTALPALREDLGGIVSDRQIVESLAIGRLSTGPSGLYVVSLGYFALGFPGAAVALLAAM